MPDPEKDDKDELLLDTLAPEDDADPDNQDEDVPGPDDEGDEEEVVIGFGDDAAPEVDDPNDTNLVKQLRAVAREQAKELAALRKASAPKPEPIVIGEKPTLESCEWDEDRLADELLAWNDRKQKAAIAETEAEKAATEAAERSAKVMAAYAERRAEIPDIDEAEATITADMGEEFGRALAYASGDPAFIKALALFPDKRKLLADLKTDPLKAIFEAGKLAAGVTVTKRRKAPDPDQVERGGGAPKNGDRELEKLREQGRKSGDYSAYLAAKRRKG